MKKMRLVFVVVFVMVLVGCYFNTMQTTDTESSSTTMVTTDDTVRTDDTTTVTDTTAASDTTEETTRFFVISFEAGQGSDVDSIRVASGSSFNVPTSEREGYDFLGWTLDNTEEADIINDPFQPDGHITLYAKWRVNQYTISFDTNGGSVIEPITQDYHTNIAPPDAPTKEGYTFGGWYADSELTTAYDFSTMPSENMTVYAKWVIVDWSDVELYLENLVPDELSDDISLPGTYHDYAISWVSSDPDILSDGGVYHRPYQATVISLSAIIRLGQQSSTKTFHIDVAGYKSLNAPLASAYIYRDYHLVDDAFFMTLDIINCAFITADATGALSGGTVLDRINTHIMPEARENGNWVIFSVAPDSDWSAIASSSSRINTFADNIVDMINAYGFDGVDIDWETPSSSEATRFTEMMRVIHTKVKANNPNHLVTAAIAGGMWQPPRYDLTHSHPYLDYINMMTYGMVSNNGYYQNALNRSSAFDDPTHNAGKTLTSCSIEESVAIYNSYGIPNSKIIVGVAFYGIKQTRSYDSASQTWSDWVNAGWVSYDSIINHYLIDSNYDDHYDTRAGVPYIMKTDGTIFISYDDPRSIAAKSTYITENGLAGMMYWENGLDPTGTLLLAIKTGLND